jgi:vacuolar-type H+-ATPase subunit C/Vma6
LERFSYPYDPKQIELVVLQDEVDRMKKILNSVGSGPRAVVFDLLQRYETENLKSTLRMWHRNAPEADTVYLLREKICHEVPIDKILLSKTIEETIILLEGTPYKDPLIGALDAFKRTDNLFYLELALDIGYYEKLWRDIASLSRGDRIRARRLIGIEVDVRNIIWVSRLKFYYNIPLADIAHYMIPHGYRFGVDVMKDVYSSNEPGRLVWDIIARFFRGFPTPPSEGERQTEPGTSDLWTLESILWQILFREAHRSLMDYPFTISTILAFSILKRVETKNLLAVINGKRYGLGEDETRQHVIVI